MVCPTFLFGTEYKHLARFTSLTGGGFDKNIVTSVVGYRDEPCMGRC
jgi:hypothetical protein